VGKGESPEKGRQTAVEKILKAAVLNQEGKGKGGVREGRPVGLLSPPAVLTEMGKVSYLESGEDQD